MDKKSNVKHIINIILKVIPLSMGVAVVVLSAFDELEINSAITMLGIGLFCIGMSLLNIKD